ncbi:MAG TPA: patatin-like phospholipase family protein [Mycobacteriales bacterium]|nr:patatin-like phospholipase family protein [Mycobacteriales bacterium]
MSVLTGLRALRGPRAPERPFREAVVLSGGGSLGAVQVGALRALLEAGVRPDLLVGCSVGALNAAFLAVDPVPERLHELERLWRGLDREAVFGRGRVRAAQLLSVAVRKEDHLYEPDALRELVRRWVPVTDLADTAVPVHVVTTDLLSGAPVWFSAGDPVPVLTASACLPALFPPVALGGTLHVDGGVTCPVPVERALELGAERTWVVDVSGGSIGRRDARMNALDVLLLSFAISRARLDRPVEDDRPGQRVVRLPRVDVGVHELRDFSRTPAFMQAGYAVAKEAVRAELVRVPAPRRRVRQA